MSQHRWTIAALLALIVAFTAVFTLLNIARYRTLFSYDVRDEAVNNQILHNTAHGRPVFSTIKGDAIFHRHFRPIFFPLSLPYIVHSGPPTYYLTVSLLLALGALFAFALGRWRFGDARLGLAAAAAWLLFPPVHELALGNFDPETIAATFWLGAFYYFTQKRIGAFWALALLGVCCKETHAPILAAFGVLALFERRSWRWIVPPIAVGAVWFVVAVTWVIPSYTPEFRLVYNRLAGVESPNFWADFTASWLASPGAMLGQIFRPEDGYLFLKLFLAGGCFAVLSPLTLLPAGTIILQILLHKDVIPVRQAHMLAGLVPFLFAASLLGLARLSERFANRRKVAVGLLGGLLTWMIIAAFLPGPFGTGRTYGQEDYLPTTLFDRSWYLPDRLSEDGWYALAPIDPAAPVLANGRFLLPLSSRAELREFGAPLPDLGDYARFDWIALCLDEPRCPTCTYALLTPASLRTAAALLESGRFAATHASPVAVVLRRTPGAEPATDPTTTRALSILRDLADEK